jgi:hypothetical protein
MILNKARIVDSYLEGAHYIVIVEITKGEKTHSVKISYELKSEVGDGTYIKVRVFVPNRFFLEQDRKDSEYQICAMFDLRERTIKDALLRLNTEETSTWFLHNNNYNPLTTTVYAIKNAFGMVLLHNSCVIHYLPQTLEKYL